MVNQLEGWKEGTAKLPHLGRHGPRGPPSPAQRLSALCTRMDAKNQEMG